MLRMPTGGTHRLSASRVKCSQIPSILSRQPSLPHLSISNANRSHEPQAAKPSEPSFCFNLVPGPPSGTGPHACSISGWPFVFHCRRQTKHVAFAPSTSNSHRLPKPWNRSTQMQSGRNRMTPHQSHCQYRPTLWCSVIADDDCEDAIRPA